MKTLSDLYTQIVLTEAEKSPLQNPSSDEIGNLKPKQDLFGQTPKPVEGPDKAKITNGPVYQQTTGSSGSPKVSNSKMPNSTAAKTTTVKSGKEMKDTDVDPNEEEESEEKPKEDKKKKDFVKKENFNMSAFDTLFKKTIIEELEDEVAAEPTDDSGAEAAIDDIEDIGDEEFDEEGDEEGDLLSDLKELQDRLSSILSKLEGSLETGEEEEGEDYSEEDFDSEFAPEEGDGGEENEVVGESKLTALNNSKGKSLSKKDNKVKGRLGKVKGGKANAGKLKNEPTPKPLGDRKGSLQKGLTVKSGISKGDFIK